MKLVDDKGRLFGLVNIVDLLVALAVLLVLAGGIYKFRGMRLGGEEQARTVTVTVLAAALHPQMVAGVKVGDRMVAGSSFTNVVVKEIDIRPGFLVNTDSSGQRVEALDPFLKDLTVTLEGRTVITGATINLGGQEIRRGKDYFVKSLDYEFKGKILDVQIE